MATHRIFLDKSTQAFYHGVAIASEVLESLPEQAQGEQRIAMFWLFVGLNADRDLVADNQETFVAGVTTRAPRITTDDDDTDR